MGIALLMGFVITKVLLGILFFAFVTPISIVIRFTGKDFMDTNPRNTRPTYWTTRPASEDLTRYEKQY